MSNETEGGKAVQEALTKLQETIDTLSARKKEPGAKIADTNRKIDELHWQQTALQAEKAAADMKDPAYTKALETIRAVSRNLVDEAGVIKETADFLESAGKIVTLAAKLVAALASVAAV